MEDKKMGEPLKQETVVATHRPFGMRDKIGYLMGDFGNDFFFFLVSSYLMVFYTDIFHINAATVGALFMFARLWDAFADVTWGRFIDVRPASKHGKFKPWIFRMSFPLVITGVLMFVTIPGMSDGFYLAWAFVTYIVWGTLYSTVNIPYGSMASVITDKPEERTSLSTWRTAGSMLASLIINAGAPLIVMVDNKLDANRMFMAACIFGVLSICCYMACYKMSTERIAAPAQAKDNSNFKATVKGLMKNKPLLWLLVSALLLMTNVMFIGAVNIYLFKDYFESTAALSVYGVVQSVAAFAVMPLIAPLVAKFGKKEISAFGLALAAIAYYALFFMKDLSGMGFVAFAAVGLFGTAFFNTVVWAFVTDVIDYHELLTGLREDGTVYSIYSFSRKVGQAVAGGLGGFAISAVGYQAGAAQQAESTLNGIHTLGTLVPAIVYTLILLVLVFLYPLNKKRTQEMNAELAARRKK